MMQAVAVIPSAGSGRRYGTSAKLWQRLRHVPVLVRTLQQVSRVAAIRDVVVVTRRGDIAALRRLLQRYHLRKVRTVVAGGPTRMLSVWRGLQAVDPRWPYIVIHDGARPLVTPRLLEATLRAAHRTGAAIAAMPATETVKQCAPRAQHVTTPPRARFWMAQTPQVFRSSLIRRAYAQARRAGLALTDDAAAVERLGHRVTLVRGEARNLKITWPHDLRVAQTFVNGHGRPHHLSDPPTADSKKLSALRANRQVVG